ncbi:X-ray repair cross-complementing protein 5-like [Mya arenaria]|uniref:X-ray repair cross-complementing protein 5-like n=1 Tax=Mya arenaria TaxID=6604 RepID=UPI0022E83ED3|nr:X-ray repair cross-complementing protein 5-like [Mya arenaria]XP_052799775.1 X-ray repair cross-complementing protein 5-like [Mya arenaria]XP_052799777.1 X-ray repair cross-complementing protein 5-like [Mya arenaria]XP_052799778.1 X-ray repair cross-complementing protein 5-like [Mya arenaria]
MAFEFGFQNFGEDEEEDDFEGQWKGAGLRDGLILLVDCTKQMFDVENEDEEESLFQLCIRCCKTTLQNKIISSEKDLIGIVFFGTEKSKNPNDFKHIYVYQELDQPGATRILELEEMCEEKHKTFTVDYGHSLAFSLSEALWTCQNMFANSPQKVNSKRILLFTCNEDPHTGNAQLQRQAKTKASDLNETGIDLELMHLQLPGHTFDVNKFYKDLLYTDDDEMTELADPSEKLEELLTRVRSKDHKKRAYRHMAFSLGEGLEMGIGVYNLVRRCTAPYAVKLDKSNDELKSHQKIYLKDTGEVLLEQDLKKCQTYGGKKIYFEKEEVDLIKRFDPSGLYLMGFKPQKSLKIYFKVKPASFIYPDEQSVTGSTTLFTALMKKCIDRDVVPICKYIPSKSSPPRFVALLPQEEELDEHKVQIRPPGFHVIFLPFADDFRKVKFEQTPKANAEQIDAAKKVLKKLQFPYTAESFENPVLQKYWRNIEALALERDAPEEMTDYTLPDEDRIKKRAGSAITEFKDLVFPADYNPGAKRKAGGVAGDPAAKRAKAEQVAAAVDLKTEAVAGRLGKLTVAVLREKMKQENITSSGTKKADLIDTICAHYDVGM